MNEASTAALETVPDVLASPRPIPHGRRRVLVTGSAGMLGSDLVPILDGAGYEVFARPHADLDIASGEQVRATFREVRPEVVVNCAAFTNVDACETDPRASLVNARAVELLARQSAIHSAQLVQISTDYVFDGQKDAPYLEEDPTGPLSAYGRSKREGEEAAREAPGALILRSSWLFGRSGWNFVEAILKQVEEGKRTLSVVHDQRGSPTAAPDLAEAIPALLASGASGIYHFTNRGETTWFDFAREILDLSGNGAIHVEPVDSSSLGRPARRPAYSLLDTSKYIRLTGRAIRHYREPLAEYLAARSRPEA